MTIYVYNLVSCFEPSELQYLQNAGIITLKTKNRWKDLIEQHNIATNGKEKFLKTFSATTVEENRSLRTKETTLQGQVSKSEREWTYFRDRELIPNWPSPSRV